MRIVQLLTLYFKTKWVGLGTDTVCTGTSNLPTDPANIFASIVYLAYAKEARHIIVQKPTKFVLGGERRDCMLLQSSILFGFETVSSLLTESARPQRWKWTFP